MNNFENFSNLVASFGLSSLKIAGGFFAFVIACLIIGFMVTAVALKLSERLKKKKAYKGPAFAGAKTGFKKKDKSDE